MTTELTAAQKEAIKEYADDPDALLEEASDPGSPLNGLFNWEGDDDDAEAARLEIAEALIRDNKAAPAGGDDDDKAAAAVEGDPEPASTADDGQK